MEIQKEDFGATAIGEKIFIAGGHNYDDEDDNWGLSDAKVYYCTLNE